MRDDRDSDDDIEIRIPRLSTAPKSSSPAPIPAQPRKAAAKKPVSPDGYGAPNIRDWFFFSLELETALNAGVSFVEALRLIASGGPKRSIRRSADVILRHLKDGSNVAVALAHAREIPNLIRNLLLVGLRGGNLQQTLRQVVEHYSWLLEIRGRILRAVTYPAMLVILGTAVMIGRDTAVASLKGLMTTEDALVHYTLHYSLPLIYGAAAAVILAWLVYTPAVRPYFDRIILTAPVIGTIIRHYSMAVFYRVLAVLIKAGMPITEGWILACQSVPNHQINIQMQPGLRYLQDGEPLAEALRHTERKDPNAKAMAAIGEAAGESGKLLERLGAYRTEQVQVKARMITAVLSPIMIVFVFVGYFINVGALTCLAFLIVLVRRLI